MKPRGEIRIIGGQWKRTLLPVAPHPDLRPTPNRVRETLFNWLGQDLTGWHCVDAFAGTGALGFEAASRGAASVQLCEMLAPLCQKLKQLQTKLQAHHISIHSGDALRFMQQMPPACADVVFLDPPFQADLFVPALKAAARIAKPRALIYLESNRPWTNDDLAVFGLSITRMGCAGVVHYHLLIKERANG